MREKIEENINLAFSFAHKFNKYHVWNSKYDYEDIISDCLFGLVKAAKNFNADSEACFSTFAYTCMKNEIMMSLRQKKKHLDHSYTLSLYDKDGNNIDDVTLIIKKLDEYIEEDNIVDYIWLQNSMENLNDLEKQVISLYYFKNMKINNIAKMLGFSESYISKLHSKAINKLRKYA